MVARSGSCLLSNKSPTVVAVKEGAVRLASSPVKRRKEPLEAEHLRRLAEKLIPMIFCSLAI